MVSCKQKASAGQYVATDLKSLLEVAVLNIVPERAQAPLL